MLRLRDMGVRQKDLVAACQSAGVYMTKERASRIINGLSVIKPHEMEVIAKLLNRTVAEMYVDLGSFLERGCLFLSIGSDIECEYFDWERYWCTRRSSWNRLRMRPFTASRKNKRKVVGAVRRKGVD